MIADIRTGLRAFPEIARSDREALLRGIVLNDAFIRTIFRLQKTALPFARALARCVPIVDASRSFANVPADRPIVLALMHFGPVHFTLSVLQRVIGRRTTYAVHAGGDEALAVSTYLRRIGTIPLVSNETSLRFLVRAMKEDPNCVVVLAFDHLGVSGRGAVPFLGGSIAASRGLAYLADVGNAVVIPACGEFTTRSARVAVAAPMQIDYALAKTQRRERLTHDLFRMVEARVRAFPHLWTEWPNCSAHARVHADEARL